MKDSEIFRDQATLDVYFSSPKPATSLSNVSQDREAFRMRNCRSATSTPFYRWNILKSNVPFLGLFCHIILKKSLETGLITPSSLCARKCCSGKRYHSFLQVFLCEHRSKFMQMQLLKYIAVLNRQYIWHNEHQRCWFRCDCDFGYALLTFCYNLWLNSI